MARVKWSHWIEKAKETVAFYLREFGIRPLIRMVFYDLTKETPGLPNTEYHYKYFDRLLVKARQTGEIPWDAFAEDAARRSAGGDEPFQTVDQAVAQGIDYLRDLPSTYRFPFWWGQRNQVVVMVEKTGERDVFLSLTRHWNVLVAPCRGNAAWGSLKALADRLDERPVSVLYFGDFDPTGEAIPRFVHEALDFLGVVPEHFEKLAVTKEQIERFDLPHEPEEAKEIAKLLRNPLYKTWPYGLYRVEMEALLGTNPGYVRDLLEEAIASRFDQAKREEALEAEEAERLLMRDQVDELMRKIEG